MLVTVSNERLLSFLLYIPVVYTIHEIILIDSHLTVVVLSSKAANMDTNPSYLAADHKTDYTTSPEYV